MCALYNLAAWTARRQRHLAVNTGLYTALAAWEWVHVRHHLECLPATRPLEQEESPAA